MYVLIYSREEYKYATPAPSLADARVTAKRLAKRGVKVSIYKIDGSNHVEDHAE